MRVVASGERLGAYQVVAPLGAGGMGEVYRARDTRLDRDAVLKVLPAEVASDRDRIRRFEQEARAASALSHPGIVTIYEIGSHDSTVYIAMEYVDGRTLREVVGSAPLAARRVLELGAQIADALAKAHESGIVHRDLKPDNVMVTNDGFAKVLDFGLAKLTKCSSADLNAAPTVTGTTPGTVLGSVGYMSPEQASGHDVDHRSDQFSLGAVLYEMATGRRAFARPTAAQTMAAIIQDEPEPIASLNPRVPAPLRWIVERCLAKEPGQRYESTLDLARDLATVRDRLSEASGVSSQATATAPASRRSRLLRLAAAVAAAAGLGALAARRPAERPVPTFQRLTFRRGWVQNARFTPDGHAVVYSASWDGEPLSTHLESPGSAETAPPLALPSANVLGFFPSGELALTLGCKPTHRGLCSGTLARAPLMGGAPREIQQGVQEAEWTPDGDTAVVRDLPMSVTIELPPGKALYETRGHVSFLRLSPRGGLFAFLDHPVRGADDGRVAVLDRTGKKRDLTRMFSTVRGLAWTPSGDEVLFTAQENRSISTLYAVDLAGRLRVVHRSVVSFTLYDIARDGRVLLARDDQGRLVLGAGPGNVERDLSWLDMSVVIDISDDGSRILLMEESEALGGKPVFGVRATDGSAVVRLGDGVPVALAPDGKSVLAEIGPEETLAVVPIGPGPSDVLKPPGLHVGLARFWPDGRLLLRAWESGHGPREYLFDPATGRSEALTPEGIPPPSGDVHGMTWLPSADGRALLASGGDGSLSFYPIDGGAPVPTGLRLEAGEEVVRCAPDGRTVWVAKRATTALPVYRADVRTGQRTLWKEFSPRDRAGTTVSRVVLSRNGSAYAFTCSRRLSELFLVEGLR